MECKTNSNNYVTEGELRYAKRFGHLFPNRSSVRKSTFHLHGRVNKRNMNGKSSKKPSKNKFTSVSALRQTFEDKLKLGFSTVTNVLKPNKVNVVNTFSNNIQPSNEDYFINKENILNTGFCEPVTEKQNYTKHRKFENTTNPCNIENCCCKTYFQNVTEDVLAKQHKSASSHILTKTSFSSNDQRVHELPKDSNYFNPSKILNIETRFRSYDTGRNFQSTNNRNDFPKATYRSESRATIQNKDDKILNNRDKSEINTKFRESFKFYKNDNFTTKNGGGENKSSIFKNHTDLAERREYVDTNSKVYVKYNEKMVENTTRKIIENNDFYEIKELRTNNITNQENVESSSIRNDENSKNKINDNATKVATCHKISKNITRSDFKGSSSIYSTRKVDVGNVRFTNMRRKHFGRSSVNFGNMKENSDKNPFVSRMLFNPLDGSSNVKPDVGLNPQIEKRQNELGGFVYTSESEFEEMYGISKGVENNENTARKIPEVGVKKSKPRILRRMVKRSQSFSGYDNPAYRKSISEKEKLIVEDGLARKGEEENLKKFEGKCVQNNEIYNFNDFKAGDRIASYNLPVTSFYIDKDLTNSDKIKFESYNHFSRPQTTTSNLQRFSSIGYLQDDYLEKYDLPRQRRSLDYVSKVTSTCGIRHIPDVNAKIIKHKKYSNLDIHVHALFAAVEHGHIEKAKTILESSEVDVNSNNSDGLSPLDVAFLSDNKPLIKLLITHGAKEGRKFYSPDDMRNHLCQLVFEAERRVHELGSTLRLDQSDHTLCSSSNNIPAITIGGTSSQNKTYSLWERRAKGLKKMLLGFEQIRPPDMPSAVSIEVTSTNSIMVYIHEPDYRDSSYATKYKIHWSTEKDFSTLSGYFELMNPKQLKYHINSLSAGQPYYVRVASGNIKGYSQFRTSVPSSVIPSSWRDISEKEQWLPSQMKNVLKTIFNNLLSIHPDLKNSTELYGPTGELLLNQRRKKTTIKQLFTATSKFQKHLRRGVYLSCLLYHEDKVLVTNEDFLPVIEVDETYPKKLHNDFHWFFKVSFSWCDLKWLRSEMEKSTNTSAVFRIKLLQAATQMQTALSNVELGRVYHKLIRDTEGTIVIPVINYIHSPKSVSVLNLRWIPLAKLTKRTNHVNATDSNVADILMASVPDQIAYHQVSSIKLPRGLYMSYLKMRSSVDSLQVLVPNRAPNMLPHCKIRDNPHVTAEEWKCLTKLENLKDCIKRTSFQQTVFVEQVASTARRILTYMEVTDEESNSHRLYDSEVIEISKDVSIIMMIPPVETACSAPGQRELLQRPDLLPVTVQVFEMVHFGTYQLDLISLYARLSCIIEMDLDLAQHSLRKAFSSSEVSTAKELLVNLENLHSQLNTTWKEARWILDVISAARDRLSTSFSVLHQLLLISPKRQLMSKDSNCFLQPPDSKVSKSRGSWPGIGGSRILGNLPTEISRSEQHLTSDMLANVKPPLKIEFSSELSDNQSVMTPSRSESVLNRFGIHASSQSTAEHGYEDAPRCNSDFGIITATEEEGDCSKVSLPTPVSAMIQVHAAYETGLQNGCSLKLHINGKTTAKEIVELFVKQLNMSVILKGKDGPVYPTSEMANFCLVAVIGARERCLRDDFRPLQLKEPWNSGRLYIRKKSDVLAAIEHSSKQSSSFV